MSIISVAEFKQYQGIDTNDEDALILSIINSAVAWLNRECNQTLVATSDTTRYFDSYDEECIDGDTLIFDDAIAAITEITIDGTELASSEYTTLPRNSSPYYEVTIKRSVTKAWTDDNAAGDYVSEDAIAVTGKWGHFSTAPNDIKHAIRRLAAYAYSQKDATSFDVVQVVDGVANIPQGFPVDVARLASNYRKLV